MANCPHCGIGVPGIFLAAHMADTCKKKEVPGEQTTYTLSKRELEIFHLLMNEKPNREIAKQLHISPRTVETHRDRILKKLGQKTTVGLVKFAIKNDMLQEKQEEILLKENL